MAWTYTSIMAVKEQVSTNLGDESVVLSLRSGVYYGLDEVGRRVWDLVQDATSFQEILRKLLEEYEVEPERCEHDLATLLSEFAEAELVHVDATPAESSGA